MTIIEALKAKSSNEDLLDELQVNVKLYNLALKIMSIAKEHLKLIIHQLPEYDLHDTSHSEKVLKNMEGLITSELINKLSSYELFLLYVSAYVHDCAMALPEWENKLLKLTEGVEGFTEEEIVNPLARDCQPPLKVSEAVQFVKKRMSYLYSDFNSIREFPFIPKSEVELQRDLADRLIEYQEFRNGYLDELKKIIDEGDKLKYLKYSKFTRNEFIRTTHTTRIEKFINNLAPIFIDELGGSWGASLAKDLSKICKSHGEDFNYVLKLEVQRSYFGSETANLQFIAIMLRLADIMHFSYDRAPQFMFVEKQIESQISIEHWKAKFQGLNYSLTEINDDRKLNIKYMAYCDDPSSYYFLQDYMDWIDSEIDNYFRFIHKLEFSINTKELVNKYRLKINDKIDRSQIKYNEEKFIPVSNMYFSLNQRKILELLMGVGLYKNKYLCLRELYQNSLDACRSVLAMLNNDNVYTKCSIEFGMGEQMIEGKMRKYLYCLDNGVGMTKDIVENYLLKIGNSYYSSEEFKRKSARLRESFKPVSQFGIGILSCFMIGDKMEITTKSIENTAFSKGLRFSIDGPHEHFYYLNPDEIDLETIGAHGTLVKIYLKDDENINNNYIEKLLVIIKGGNSKSIKNEYPEIENKWHHNLYKILSDSVGMLDKDINVSVKFSNNKNIGIIQWNEPFDRYINKIKPSDLKLLYTDFRYLSDAYNPFEDYMKFKDYIISYPLKIANEGIEYYFLLNLPMPNSPFKDYRVLDFPTTLFENSNVVLIDGISVSHNNTVLNSITEDTRDIYNNGILNFVGHNRPKLSVDRNSITSIPDTTLIKLRQLNEKILEVIINEISNHMKKYQIKSDCYEAQMSWDYVFSKFRNLNNELTKNILISPEVDIVIEDLSNLINKPITISQYAALSEIIMNDANFTKLSPVSEMILVGKLMGAESIRVKDLNITVQSSNFLYRNIKGKTIHDFGLLTLAVYADEWSGNYEEYDLVSGIWPIIPRKLYNNLQDEFSISTVNSRTKLTSESSNSLAAIANLDPVLINPKNGIFRCRERYPWKKDLDLVGKFENPCNDFWMFEINNHGQRLDSVKDYFVYTFISPRKLNEYEKSSIEYFKEEDREYYEGIINGWSILFLGKTSERIIVPGIRPRAEVVKMISKRFWEKNSETKFYFLDGTPIKQV